MAVWFYTFVTIVPILSYSLPFLYDETVFDVREPGYSEYAIDDWAQRETVSDKSYFTFKQFTAERAEEEEDPEIFQDFSAIEDSDGVD